MLKIYLRILVVKANVFIKKSGTGAANDVRTYLKLIVFIGARLTQIFWGICKD